MPVALLISDSGALGPGQLALLREATGLAGERVLACPEGPLADAGRNADLRVLPLAVSGALARVLWLRRLILDLSPGRVLVAGRGASLARLLAAGRRTPLAAGRHARPDAGSRAHPAAADTGLAVSADTGLAVVTVTRNSGRELRAMLASLARHLPGAQVVVVDCASYDDSVEIARSAGASVVELDRNVGFGAANNTGLREVSAPVTALLNPDVELLDDSLLGCSAEALRTERLLAPLVLSPDGARQDTVHPLPGSPAELARSVLPHRTRWLAPWRARSPRPVGWAVGCAVVAPTRTLADLGPFDERIFLYYEDLDLSLHARQAGVQTWFWPAARVLHHRAHSSEREFGGEPFELLARARRTTVARRLGARAARVDDLSQAATFATRLVAKRLLGRECARERRQLAAVRTAR